MSQPVVSVVIVGDYAAGTAAPETYRSSMHPVRAQTDLGAPPPFASLQP